MPNKHKNIIVFLTILDFQYFNECVDDSTSWLQQGQVVLLNILLGSVQTFSDN